MGSTLPALNQYFINDLVPGVIAALTGKTNITPNQAAVWIKKTLLNLTESYPFEELRVLGPLVTIGPGLGLGGSNFMYPISMFLNPGDDYTLSENPVIFFTPAQAMTAGMTVGLIGTGQFQNGQVAYPMPYMTYKAIQPLLFISGGIPSRWSHYGPNFYFGTQPAQNYQLYLPYQRRYPFNQNNLLQTPLYIPTSWMDVVEYSAALRGAQENRWPDMVQQLHSIIYGDPRNPAEPGLLKSLVSQISRDEDKSTRSIQPVISRY